MNLGLFFIYLYVVYVATKLFISWRQLRFLSSQDLSRPVLMSEEEYGVAARYAFKKEQLSFISCIIDLFLFIFWVFIGFAQLGEIVATSSESVKTVVFAGSFFALGFVVSLPLEWYKKFRLDAEFGFNKSSQKLFLIDNLKQIALFAVLAPPVMLAIVWFIQNYESWWLITFVFLFSIIILINLLYPTVIAPIFNKFTPLEDGELKGRIEGLMQHAGFKSSGVFTIDAGKRDGRLNAYFGGLGATKRVVLFDTLIEKLSRDEIVSVLGHELGHFKHGDIYKNIALMAIMLFGFCYLFAHLPPDAYAAVSFTNAPHATLMMFLLFSEPLGFFFAPIVNFVSRKNEFAADEFATTLAPKEFLKAALLKLVGENKSFPKSDSLFALFYHSHPEVVTRIERLS